MPFNKNVYQSRREQLARYMMSGVAVIRTATEKKRNGSDNMYPFRPDSNFYYLTGFDEPEAVLVVIAENEMLAKSVLFCRTRCPEAEVWDGERLGSSRAPEVLGVDEAYPIESFDEKMDEIEADFPCFSSEEEFYTLCEEYDDPRLQWMLSEMRLRKWPEEIDIMRRAARISTQGHINAMRFCEPGMMEYELETALTTHFRQMDGDPLHAYPPIVAGGNNACTLHYVKNNQELRDGDLILIDAGCELDGYASDITRTFPVNGTFTWEQKAIYELVLEAQKVAIDAVCSGNRFQGDPQDVAMLIITQGLADLGILEGRVGELFSNGAYKRFCPHKIGHWLGLDVHDTGEYKDDERELEPGMVVTIEPGIYIPEGMKGVDPKWHGIGIRIEDDVLVTEDEPEVLSKGAPKEVEEIEKVMCRISLNPSP